MAVKASVRSSGPPSTAQPPRTPGQAQCPHPAVQLCLGCAPAGGRLGQDQAGTHEVGCPSAPGVPATTRLPLLRPSRDQAGPGGGSGGQETPPPPSFVHLLPKPRPLRAQPHPEGAGDKRGVEGGQTEGAGELGWLLGEGTQEASGPSPRACGCSASPRPTSPRARSLGDFRPVLAAPCPTQTCLPGTLFSQTCGRVGATWGEGSSSPAPAHWPLGHTLCPQRRPQSPHTPVPRNHRVTSTWGGLY